MTAPGTLMAGRHRPDAGSASVELAVLCPAILLVLLLAIGAGRIASAREAVDHVATAAARAASLARTPGTAQAAASTTAQLVLTERGLDCRSHTISVDTSGFVSSPSRPGIVRVNVSCSVPLADLGLVFGGTARIRSSFASPVDPFRGSS